MIKISSAFISVLWICFSAAFGSAQVSVNSSPYGRETDGLVVASTQLISVQPKVLRGFATIKSDDKDYTKAIEQLKTKKRQALEGLVVNDIPEKAAKFSSPRILEWELTNKNNLFPAYPNHLHFLPLSPRTDSQSYTAILHVSFDIPLAAKDADEFALMPGIITELLHHRRGFEGAEFMWLYIGEVSQDQIATAAKQAFEEAQTNARSIIALTGKPLGPLVGIKPEFNGRAPYGTSFSNNYWNAGYSSASPLVEFAPSANEVYGSDPARLSSSYTLELRYKVE